uniref:Uncharacterized protein n=1 Tax=Rhizophora mucronata TaxID=61149 RepID=A0A2P2IW99_RHIMU
MGSVGSCSGHFFLVDHEARNHYFHIAKQLPTNYSSSLFFDVAPLPWE